MPTTYATAEYPQVGSDWDAAADWRPVHRRILAFAAIVLGAAIITWILYGFVSGLHLAPPTAAVLLCCAAVILTILAASGFLAAKVVKLQCEQVEQVALRASEERRAEERRSRVVMATCHDRLEVLTHEIRELRGIAQWAAQLDRRLAELQTGLRPKVGAARDNGHHDTVSPLELSDDALRGYFRGFYDREPKGDASTD